MMKEMKELKSEIHKPEQIKAINKVCETCGGPHAYYDCQATDASLYPAPVAAVNQNQYRPHAETQYRAPNAMVPPGFPPVPNQNNQNRFVQNQGQNFNNSQNFNQNRGQNQGNYNQKPWNVQNQNQTSSDELLRQFIKSQEETNKT
jgi:hypothetical protein